LKFEKWKNRSKRAKKAKKVKLALKKQEQV
jgi:hypothetical protein